MPNIKILAFKENHTTKNMLTAIVNWNASSICESFIQTKAFNIGNNKKIVVYEASIDNNKIETFKNNILKNQKLYINSKESIQYNILKDIRISFLNSIIDNSDDKKILKSPFNNNAVVYENWSTDIQLRETWINLDKNIQKELSEILPVDLYYMIDRIGNLVHFKEIEELIVAIMHQNDNFITLGFEIFDGFIENKYIGTIEVKSFDDVILKESFSINNRFIDFPLQDEDYNIFVEVYNKESGKCVFSHNFIFIKEITLSSHILNSSTLEIVSQNGTIHKTIPLKTTGSKSVINSNHSNIINLQSYRNTYTNKIINEESLQFVPFKTKPEAINHLCKQITKMADSFQNPKYIYLADPYFLRTVGKITLPNYLDIFNSASSIELRILCTYNEIENDLKSFIQNNKNHIFNNITMKSIYQKRKDANGYLYELNDDGTQKQDPAGNLIFAVRDSFHDRWIACINEENGFTNSINNFEKGVSFFKSLKHYYTEAETLWNIETSNPDFIIKEFKLW